MYVQLYLFLYKVLRRSEKMFELQVGYHVETVATDWLKPHTGADLGPALPLHLGRPPGSGGSGSLGSELAGGLVAAERNP